jgi:hypothetical protein
MGCAKEASKLKNMFSVVLRNVVLLYPNCIGTRKSSTLSMENSKKKENIKREGWDVQKKLQN